MVDKTKQIKKLIKPLLKLKPTFSAYDHNDWEETWHDGYDSGQKRLAQKIMEILNSDD